jgi:hypothetical protein
VHVDHAARWRLGPLSGTLHTRLKTIEDRAARRVTFSLREKGFMKEFDGEWRVAPFSQAAVDALFGRKEGGLFTRAGALLDSAVAAVRPGAPHASLVTLTQRVAPAAMPPAPIDSFFARIAARQVRTLLDDLRAEAARRAAGLPSALEGGDDGSARRRRRGRGGPLLW